MKRVGGSRFWFWPLFGIKRDTEVVYYESIKRELKIRCIYECLCGSQWEGFLFLLVVYYESITRKLKIKCIYECRCYERLQIKTKEFTLLTYTGLVVELEHLKIETRLIDEKFVNVMGEYVTQMLQVYPTLERCDSGKYKINLKLCLLWINKTKTKDKMYMSVGVMKDYKLKLKNLLSSRTLGWSWNWNT